MELTQGPESRHEKSVLPCLVPETSDFHLHTCKSRENSFLCQWLWHSPKQFSLWSPIAHMLKFTPITVAKDTFLHGGWKEERVSIGKYYQKNKDGFQMHIHIKCLLYTLNSLKPPRTEELTTCFVCVFLNMLFLRAPQSWAFISFQCSGNSPPITLWNWDS